MVRRSSSYLLKAPKNRSVVLPGEALTVDIPEEAPEGESWAVEPRFDHTPFQWFSPQEVTESKYSFMKILFKILFAHSLYDLKI